MKVLDVVKIEDGVTLETTKGTFELTYEQLGKAVWDEYEKLKTLNPKRAEIILKVVVGPGFGRVFYNTVLSFLFPSSI